MARPKSEEKYDAIMQATLALVNELGFQGLSMAKIAKKAGVATATIYVYFENTEGILNQLYMDLKQLVAKDLLKGYKPYMTTKEGYEIIWKNQFKGLITYGLEYNFLGQFSNSPYITSISREEGMRQFQPITDFFKEGMKKGDIKEMPSDLIFPLFYAPLSALAKSVIAGHAEATDPMFELAMESTWNAISR